MSDTVDNVMDTVNESEPSEDVVVSEATEPVEEAVDEVVEPVSASEAEEAEEAPVVHQPQPEPVASEEPEPEPAHVSTQEVVQNVQEILSSTETNVTVDNSESSELEARVKFLEERLEKLIGIMEYYFRGRKVRDCEMSISLI